MAKKAISIVKKLQKSGFEAYFAGGSVRDLLLKKEPQDFDIATSARPEDIEKLFKKVVPVGKKFGVMIVVVNNDEFEVATFRGESSYDGRWPGRVHFTNAARDALRRDFTINGLFYDPINRKIIDYVQGEKDLKKKIIRFIGSGRDRIKEDYLRILRAVRFKNALSFKYAFGLKWLLKKNAGLLKKISKERIREELNKMLLSKNRSAAIKDMEKIGILKVVLPEIARMKGVAQPRFYHREGDVFTHTLKVLDSLPKNASLELIWSCLFHDIGKPATYKKFLWFTIFRRHAEKSAEITEKVLKRLRFSAKEVEDIVWLVKYHMTFFHIFKMRKSKVARLFFDPRFETLLALYKADTLGTIPNKIKEYNEVEKFYLDFKKKMPLRPPHLVSGHDIMKMFKIEEGPEVGKILKIIEEKQLSGEIKTRKEAREYLKKLKTKNYYTNS